MLAGCMFAMVAPLRHSRATSGTFCSLFSHSAGFLTSMIRAHSVYTPVLEKKMAPVSSERVVEAGEYLELGQGARIVLGSA